MTSLNSKIIINEGLCFFPPPWWFYNVKRVSCLFSRSNDASFSFGFKTPATDFRFPDGMIETEFPTTWKQSFLYLSFILTSLYLLHSSVLQRLLLGHEKVHVKRLPDLPLRFRSDGTFKILQVSPLRDNIAVGFLLAWAEFYWVCFFNTVPLVHWVFEGFPVCFRSGGRYALRKWGCHAVQGCLAIWVRVLLGS